MNRIHFTFVSYIGTNYSVLLHDGILTAKYINCLKFIGNLEYIKENDRKHFTVDEEVKKW